MTGIYISHSSDAPFTEKRFIVDLVQQLKENNLADDVWLVFIDTVPWNKRNDLYISL